MAAGGTSAAIATAGASGSNSAAGVGGVASAGSSGSLAGSVGETSQGGGSGSTTGGSSGSTTGGSSGSTTGGGSAGGAAENSQPLLGLLGKFTAADVPVRGPSEDTPDPITFNGTVPTWPGNGLAQHPMLYVGENYNRISLVNEGKVVWTYDTKGSWELDDIWMLSNGNVLYSHQTYAEEITPTKQVVWHYDAPGNSEIHTLQPLGLDKVVIGMNQDPMPKVLIINTVTNAVELEHTLPDGASNSVHGQTRRMRLTGDGTYLVAWLSKGKVVEYDKNFAPIWSYSTPKPWSVTRLRNGNTLIQDENDSTCKEVNPQGDLVWSLKESEISVPGAKLAGNNQTCERLANGNTVMFNHSPSPGNLQAVEVTPNKQVVWALEDYQHLKDATSAHFLDQPGLPEVPGATDH